MYKQILIKVTAILTLSLLVALALILLSQRLESGYKYSYKYTIRDARGNGYHTNSYTVEGECIIFQTCKCGDGVRDGMNMQICGSYSIAENPDYQP